MEFEREKNHEEDINIAQWKDILNYPTEKAR